ncbi:C-C motif chemokine 3-like [Chanos chanos]|uniref:C-C motif chemokine n=1 Tax=Chanos chanos TaxID=29144 RepID=A0A6J2V8H3_CHACN|nr:C-C motif chemokine 3-like [Chanos chanos]
MKPYCIAAIALLLFAFCSLSESSSYPAQCCFKFINIKIPVKAVLSYSETYHECSKPGVIFTTVRQRNICADPREPWVINLMNSLDVKEKQFCADPTKTWVRDLMNYLDGIELTTGSGDSSSSPTTMAPSKH